MARVDIISDNYKVKAFLDTNIILEGRPLSELPWQEVDADGPILALITPTVIKEIDSKKQDGRLGKYAREFNRLIAPVAAGGSPIIIKDSSPRVEIALSSTVRIPWKEYNDLDPEDSDSCIVAEVLHAKGMKADGKLLVSHDIKPIAFASNYDLPTLHVSDEWLRQPEPHPKDREIQKLKHQLKEYEVTEPAFEITMELIDKEAVEIVQIEDLTDDERASIYSRILELNPKVTQSTFYGMNVDIPSHDYSYDKKFDAYLKQVPVFVANYAQNLERLFNQARISLRVRNVGKVQAENILLEVSVTNGWIHDRFAFVSPQGPSAPKPENSLFPMHRFNSIVPSRIGRPEFGFREAPKCGRHFSVTCEDFRHGQEYNFQGVVSMDARSNNTAELTINVTASNFRGVSNEFKIIQRKIERLHVSRLIDMSSLKINGPLPMQDFISNQTYGEIDFKVLNGMAEAGH